MLGKNFFNNPREFLDLKFVLGIVYIVGFFKPFYVEGSY